MGGWVVGYVCGWGLFTGSSAVFLALQSEAGLVDSLFSLLIKPMGKSRAKNVKWLPHGHTISLSSHQEDTLSALPGPGGWGRIELFPSCRQSPDRPEVETPRPRRVGGGGWLSS